MKLIQKFRKLLNYEKNLNKLHDKFFFSCKADQMTQFALKEVSSGITEKRYNNKEIIVSLTTHGKRLYEVYLPIESIMQGTLKPNRIILWLSTEYKNKPLPILLQNQINRGLEIEFCEDIRSYTKLIPALKKYPESVIVTIDDDLIYNTDMLEKLVIAYLNQPTLIHANRVHKIKLNHNNQPLPYFKWDWESKECGPSYLNFLTGVGGVLYPPHCLDQEVFNQDVFLDICKYADDIWFYSMAIKKGTKINKVYTHSPNSEEYIENPNIQDIGLIHKNLNRTQFNNDTQLKNVFDKYNLYNELK